MFVVCLVYCSLHNVCVWLYFIYIFNTGNYQGWQWNRTHKHDNISLHVCTRSIVCAYCANHNTHHLRDRPGLWLFKSICCSNWEVLPHFFERENTLLMFDLSLLVFGAIYGDSTQAVVEDFFDRAFSIKSNTDCWIFFVQYH